MRRALGIGAWVLAVAAGLGIFLLLPHLVSDFHSRDLARAGVFFIAIVGLNLLTGYTGQISLGHGALMAIGGYTTAALVVHEHWRDVWTIPLAGIAAGIVGFALAWLIVRGRLGRVFRSVRDSEIAAVSSGVNLAATKTLAFALSGVYAGVAGALLAIQDEIVNPLTYTFLLSILVLVGAVVGGLGSLPGLVLGALFVQYLPKISTHVSGRSGVRDFVYGAAIIVVMILLPTGAGGLLRRVVRPLTTWLYTRP